MQRPWIQIPLKPGGRVLPYITYMGMCRLTGRGFEAPDLERGID